MEWFECLFDTKNASNMDIEIYVFNWIVVILHPKVDINFKEFDGINDETKNNLLPLVRMLISVYSVNKLYTIILSSLQEAGTKMDICPEFLNSNKCIK